VRGLVLAGPGRVVVADDLEEPRVESPGDVVVEVEASGLCGSDLHPYEGRERARAGVVPGHEVVGRVVAAGAEVTSVRVGGRVVVPFTTSCGTCDACRRGLSARCEHGGLFGFGDPDHLDVPALHGGQAERVRVPLADGTVVALDDDLNASTAVLLSDNLPTAWAALARTEVASGGRVLVVGLGAVGLCTVALAASRDLEVVAVDPVASRRDAAAGLGATRVLTPDDLEAWTGEAGPRARADAAVEASGSDAGQRGAAAALRPGGVLSLIAVQTAPRFAVTPVEAYDRNLTIRAGRAPVRSLLPEVLAAVASGSVRVPTAAVVTHPDRPLDDGPALYRAAAAREPGLVKATFRP
jgi:alcohol dehydrogenase